jgi:predicted nucleic acid-binding Zn ribbon protein
VKTPRPRSKGSRPVRVDRVLAEVLEEAGVLRQVRRMEVLDLWPELVGEQLARVTKARAVDGGTLIVEVKSSAWLMELNMMRGDFLRRVNERLEEVPLDKIVFVLAETE